MTTTTHTHTTFDVSALRAGIEQRDAGALTGLYAADASIEIADADHGPSRPLRIVGAEAIAAHLADVYGRAMEHRVELVAATGDTLGYTVRCAYPDGTLVRCVAMAELRDGRIVRELVAQAWDR
jgi:ketosteroid isomerase-like protein